MIGVDTNLLLRGFIIDDGRQSKMARRWFLESRSPIYVNRIVLCETVWVLQARYRYDRGQLAEAIGWLLTTEGLEIEDRDAVEEALARFRGGAGGFTDALIGITNRRAGCRPTSSFDRRTASLPEFAAVPDG